MGGDETERRQSILSAAERLLHHYGPQKTTMAEIAREAQVGVGSVYLEFASKEAIVCELSARRHASVLAAMRDAMQKSERAAERTFEGKLRAMLDARTTTFLKLSGDGAHARDLVFCGESAVKTSYARYLDEERALVTGVLRDAMHEGEIDLKKKPEFLAAVVLRAYATFAPPFVFQEPAEDVKNALKCLHVVVLRGLARRD